MQHLLKFLATSTLLGVALSNEVILDRGAIVPYDEAPQSRSHIQRSEVRRVGTTGCGTGWIRVVGGGLQQTD